jgi:hypothetical protein
MSETFCCDDKETLVAYLYGEIDADGRREVERHLRSCAACGREVDELRAVRQDLAAWQPPEPDLGFTIVQKPAAVLRPPRWAAIGSLPAWAQVAAALLVIALSASILNLQVRYDNDGFTVNTGWMTPRIATSTMPSSTATVSPVMSTDENWKPALTALEQNLRRDLADVRRHAESASIRSDGGTDTSAVLRRVQAMLDASEHRQREEIALRLAQADRDWNIKRQADLVNISRNFGTLQGRTFRTAADQQEMMNLLRRVSVQPVP